MLVKYTTLYEHTEGDPTLWRDSAGTYVARPTKGWLNKMTLRSYAHVGAKKERDQPCMRMRGFVFQVDGRYQWDADPPYILWMGRWLGAYEAMMFKRPYVTTRRHGFAIYFERQDDAEGFQLQCLDNESVFTGRDPLMRSYVPKKRPSNQQLPFGQDRMLSDCFSAELQSRLYVCGLSPLEPDRNVWCSLGQLDKPYSKYSTLPVVRP